MFTHVNKTIDANTGSVVEIEARLIVEDAEGDINITDLMLQGGSIGTQWVGHPSEIKWTVDG